MEMDYFLLAGSSFSVVKNSYRRQFPAFWSISIFPRPFFSCPLMAPISFP